jgi:hypothetical protein
VVFSLWVRLAFDPPAGRQNEVQASRVPRRHPRRGASNAWVRTSSDTHRELLRSLPPQVGFFYFPSGERESLLLYNTRLI